MLLHQSRLRFRGSRHHRHANSPARRRARRPLREDLEPRTLLTIDFVPASGVLTAVDGGGLKLDSPNVYLIFWGSTWATAYAQLENTLVSDAEDLLSSGYFLGLRQYGADGKANFGGFINDETYCPDGFTQGALLNVVLSAVVTHDFPSPNQLATTPLYMVLTPPDVECDQTGNPPGVTADGYHDCAISPFDGNIIYGVSTSFGQPSEIDSYTWCLSHEIAESITDPIPRTGITIAGAPSTADEICDGEANRHDYRLGGPGGILVQSYWSQLDQDYIIPDGTPQTIWDEGGSLWILPEQDGSNASNYVAITEYYSGLQIWIDSSRYWFDPGTGSINGIVAFLTGPNDVISLVQTPVGCPVIADLEASGCGVYIASGWAPELADIQSNVTIGFYSSGASVDINDGSDTNGVSWSIQGNSISQLGAGTAATINLMGQSGDGNAVTIDGGSGSNNFLVNNGPGAFATTINTGNGNDGVSVLDSSGGLTVNTGAGVNNVVIGGPLGSDAAYLDGNVAVSAGWGGTTNVTVDDQSDTSSRAWNIQGDTMTCGGAGTIALSGQSGDGNAVTIDGGSGSNNYVVNNGPAGFTTTLNTGNGNDHVSVYDSGGGLTVNTGAGLNNVVIGGPLGADAAYLDGNVLVSGGSGGTTNVWILDYQNATPTTWYDTDRLYYVGGLLKFVTTYQRSGSPYTITLMNNISSVAFLGSSSDTLVYSSPYLYGLAGMAELGMASGPTGGMSPLPPESQAGAGRGPRIAGAADTSSGRIHDLALESILADWSASAFAAAAIGPLARGDRIRAV